MRMGAVGGCAWHALGHGSECVPGLSPEERPCLPGFVLHLRRDTSLRAQSQQAPLALLMKISLCLCCAPGRSLQDKREREKTPSERQQKRMFTGTFSASWSWDLYFTGWRLAVGGGWRLAVGSWRLTAVGGWRLVVPGGCP